MTFSHDHAVLNEDSVLVNNVPESYVLSGLHYPVTAAQLDVRFCQKYLTLAGVIPLWPLTKRFPAFKHHGEFIRINPDFLSIADQEKLRQLKQKAGWAVYQYIGALFILGCFVTGILSAHFSAKEREENIRSLMSGDVLAIEDTVHTAGLYKMFFYRVAAIDRDSILLEKANFEIVVKTEFTAADHSASARDTANYSEYSSGNLWLARKELNAMEYRIRHVYQRKDN